MKAVGLVQCFTLFASNPLRSYFDILAPVAQVVQCPLWGTGGHGFLIIQTFGFFNSLPLQYKWTVPSRWDSVRYRLEDSSRILTIEDVRLDDSGTFSCTVVGKGGRRDATQYTLNVECKRSFVRAYI